MLVISAFDFSANRLCPACGQARSNTRVFATLLL